MPPTLARFFVAFSLLTVTLGCGGGSSVNAAGFSAEVFIPNADFPTAVRFSPDGRMFYTEKNSGNVRIVENGSLLSQPFATLPVGTDGEQGLLGLAFDPDFANNHYVYVFYSEANPAAQRVARFTDTANVGTNFTVIVDNLPRGSNHNSGRLAFGQDGKLYVTVGETGDPANSQNVNVPGGKVLRYNPDGSIPNDNPIPGNPLFTLGHRNCFGLAMFPSTGTFYVSENGPTCDDEINRLTPGGNYGWRPNQPCGDTDPNYIRPVRRYPSIIAPSGICFYTGSLYPDLTGNLLLATYEEGAIRSLKIDDAAPGHVLSESVLVHVPSATDVTTGPDGNIYVATQDSIVKLIRPV